MLTKEQIAQMDAVVGGSGSTMQQSNQTTQSSGLTPEKIAQMDSIVSSGGVPTGSFGQRTYSIEQPAMEKPSGASFAERLYLEAFADESGKEKYFRDKGYQIVTRDEQGNLLFGNSMKDLRPYDPVGITGDVFGEAADLLSQAPQIGASILGGALGSAGGPLGAMATAGAAGATAELGMKGIGKTIGLNTQKASEVGVDALITGLGSFAGEGLGQALKAPTAKEVARKSFKYLGKQLEKIPFTPTKDTFIKGFAKLTSMTSGVPEDKIIKAFQMDPDVVFAQGSGTPERLLNIVDDFSNTVINQEKTLGNLLGQSEDRLLRNASRYKVNTLELQKSVLESMRQLGLVEKNGQLIPELVSGKSEQAMLKIAFDILNPSAGEVAPGVPIYNQAGKIIGQKKIPVLNLNPNAEISADKLISLRDQLKRAINSSSDKEFQTIAGKIVRGTAADAEKPLHGISDEVAKMAQQIGDKTYLASRENYANFKGILDRLSTYGLNPKINKLSIENVTKGSADMSEVLRREMSQSELLKPYLKQMDIWDIANTFSKSNPNFMRFNTVAGAFGLGAMVGGKTPEEKLGGFATAMTFGTPAGLKVVMKSLKRLPKLSLSSSRTLKGLSNLAKNRIAQQTVAATISQNNKKGIQK